MSASFLQSACTSPALMQGPSLQLLDLQERRSMQLAWMYVAGVRFQMLSNTLSFVQRFLFHCLSIVESIHSSLNRWQMQTDSIHDLTKGQPGKCQFDSQAWVFQHQMGCFPLIGSQCSLRCDAVLSNQSQVAGSEIVDLEGCSL